MKQCIFALCLISYFSHAQVYKSYDFIIQYTQDMAIQENEKQQKRQSEEKIVKNIERDIKENPKLKEGTIHNKETGQEIKIFY